MSYQRQRQTYQRARYNSGPISRFGPETITNYTRAFSKSVFYHEISASFSVNEWIIALTDDDSNAAHIIKMAQEIYQNVFYVIGSKCERKHTSEEITCPILTITEFFLRLSYVPDGSCIIFGDLWLIGHPSIGGLFEQILVLLGSQCNVVLISKPYSNITVFYHWLSSIRQPLPRIIEAPIERCPSSYFVLSENTRELRLIRNSTLSINSIALQEAIDASRNAHPEPDIVNFAIDKLLENGFGPVMVVFPTVGHIRKMLEKRSACHFLSPKTPEDELRSIINSFSNSTNNVLFTTIKLAESIYIPTHSIVLTSFLKYDGVTVRYMQPFEFYHLTRSAGRPGLDSQGIVAASLHSKIPTSYIMNILMADIPSINPQFTVNTISFLNCIYFQICDLDQFVKKTFQAFCQMQVIPILQEQLAQLSPIKPPDEIGDLCIDLINIETAISTICTHPKNIRRLLTNGRVVKIRPMIAEKPWGICFGNSVCGTITLAIKGLPTRGRTLDGDEKCLVTVPIHDILAIADTIMPIQRQMLQEIDQGNIVIEHEYPLYNGDDLVVGNERLHEMHNRWNQQHKRLEPALAPKYREIGDLSMKYLYVSNKIENLQNDGGIGNIRWLYEAGKRYAILPFNNQVTPLFTIIRELNVKNGYILKPMTDQGYLQRWSVIEVICALSCLVSSEYQSDKRSAKKYNSTLTDDVNSLFNEMSYDGYNATQYFSDIYEWFEDENSEIDIYSCDNWNLGCVIKRIMSITKTIEIISTNLGINWLSQKMKLCREYILQSPKYKLFFT